MSKDTDTLLETVRDLTTVEPRPLRDANRTACRREAVLADALDAAKHNRARIDDEILRRLGHLSELLRHKRAFADVAALGEGSIEEVAGADLGGTQVRIRIEVVPRDARVQPHAMETWLELHGIQRDQGPIEGAAESLAHYLHELSGRVRCTTKSKPAPMTPVGE